MLFKLKILFISMIIFGITYLSYNIYDYWNFNHNPIDINLEMAISKKRDELINRTLEFYGIYLPVPIKIENIPNRLYGITTLSKNGSITIILNKKIFKESFNYIIESVLPHEFAHAIMFHRGKINGDGHSNEWREICIQLRGKKCDQYVNIEDIIIEKL